MGESRELGELSKFSELGELSKFSEFDESNKLDDINEMGKICDWMNHIHWMSLIKACSINKVRGIL